MIGYCDSVLLGVASLVLKLEIWPLRLIIEACSDTLSVDPANCYAD